MPADVIAVKVGKQRAFLKWAGGKYRLMEVLHKRLPKGKRLIEPFVGAGSVFLNSDYDAYLLNDINPDLIALYKIVQSDVDKYIADSQSFFSDEHNNSEQYYELREQFNQSRDPYYRSILFLYLNRHGYNGLCRYNKSGGYNVPFGSYKKPYFPEAELQGFAIKAQSATFYCESYQETIKRAKQGDVIYCDPPYAPLTATANFTGYASNDFSLNDQAMLAKVARTTADEADIPILLSNHDTPLTRELYRGSKISKVTVQRNISRDKNKRNKVGELMALYMGNTKR